MNESEHTAVWIDKHKAHVFRVGADTHTEVTIHSPEHTPRHPAGQAQPHNHPDDEHRFFAAVAETLRGSSPVLVLGPAQEKLHFRDYVTAHASTLGFAVAGLETVDHPTENQIAALVRKYFLAKGAHQQH